VKYYSLGQKYLCRAYNVGSVVCRVKSISLGQKYICRAYNVGSVVEWKFLVWVNNISVEPTMLVVLYVEWNLSVLVKISL
jgi:hypothetical protein